MGRSAVSGRGAGWMLAMAVLAHSNQAGAQPKPRSDLDIHPNPFVVACSETIARRHRVTVRDPQQGRGADNMTSAMQEKVARLLAAGYRASGHNKRGGVSYTDYSATVRIDAEARVVYRLRGEVGDGGIQLRWSRLSSSGPRFSVEPPGALEVADEAFRQGARATMDRWRAVRQADYRRVEAVVDDFLPFTQAEKEAMRRGGSGVLRRPLTVRECGGNRALLVTLRWSRHVDRALGLGRTY